MPKSTESNVLETSFASTNRSMVALDNPLDILLIEDTVSDAVLTRIALKASGIAHKLHTIQNGNDAMPYLHQCKRCDVGLLPDLIMLDLGLPGVNGFDILAALAQAHPAIRAIPIIILTGHQDFEYIDKIYNLWIVAYIHKPCSIVIIRQILRRINLLKHASI